MCRYGYSVKIPPARVLAEDNPLQPESSSGKETLPCVITGRPLSVYLTNQGSTALVRAPVSRIAAQLKPQPGAVRPRLAAWDQSGASMGPSARGGERGTNQGY